MLAVGERSSAEKSGLFRFAVAYYLRSTALVMPILPIWWTEFEGISTSTYLAFMALAGIVPIVADIPLSIWADKSNPKIPYALGLVVFAVGFLQLLFIEGIVSFYAYLIAISFAGALMSGSDSALLFNIVGENGFTNAMFNLTRRFYTYTAGLFLVGVALFTVSPHLLFGAQCTLLGIAATMVWSIKTPIDPSNQERLSVDSGESIDRVSRPFRSRGLLVLILVLVVIGALFDGVVQFQNRAFQLLTYDATESLNLEISGLWVVAIMMVASNLLSVVGVSKWASRSIQGVSESLALTVLLLTAVVALAVFAWGSFGGLLVGVLLFSGLKGAYRPYLGGLMAMTIPSKTWKARWFSFLGVGSAIVGAGANALVATFASTSQGISLAWLFLMIIVGVPIVILVTFATRKSVRISNGMSGKNTTRQFDPLFGRKDLCVQEYPKIVPVGEVETNARLSQSNSLQAPELVSVEGRVLITKYFDSTALMNLDSDSQLRFLQDSSIIRDLSARSLMPLQGNDRPERGTSATKFMSACEEICQCYTIQHGDLHPGNVLVNTEGQYVAIDWDQSGVGPRALDEIGLLFHPDLKLPIMDRIRLLGELSVFHYPSCKLARAMSINREFQIGGVLIVVVELLDKKLDDIRSWSGNYESKRLQIAYEDLRRELVLCMQDLN